MQHSSDILRIYIIKLQIINEQILINDKIKKTSIASTTFDALKKNEEKHGFSEVYSQ